jgi:hypothetical protein
MFFTAHNQNMSDYSTDKVSEKLLQEVKDALIGLSFGSVEIYVADGEVTQITKRLIKKTNGNKE